MIQRLILHFYCLIGLQILVTQSPAQERKITPLNEHFFPILNKNSGVHTFNQVSKKSQGIESSTKIYSLENKLVKSIEESFNEKEGYQQRFIYRYDTMGSLQSLSLVKINENQHLTQYFQNDTVVAEVQKLDNDQFQVRLNGVESIQTFFDPFKPGIADPAEWQNHLRQNLSYPLGARRTGISGMVVIAAKIAEDGNLIAIEIANPDPTKKLLEAEALAKAQEYPGKWRAAINLDGTTEAGWAYIPIRFKMTGDPDEEELDNVDILY
ncbi:energy transducer TonB [Algoriphagus namhaensis]